MKSIPPDELIHIIQHWINQDWPLTEEQAKQACRNLGWIENEDGDFDTPYDFKINYVFLTINLKVCELRRVDFRLTDVSHENSVTNKVELNDIFVQYIETFKPLWGKPKLHRDKDYQRASWDELPKACRVDISKGRESLSCYFYSPESAETARYLTRRGLN